MKRTPLPPRTQPLKRSQKPIAKRRKVKKSSLKWQNVNDEYKLFPDGRMVHFETAKGQEWYRTQTLEMAKRQHFRCGLIDSGNCLMPKLILGLFGNRSLTFEHADKRGAGKQDDNINAPGNCAAHFLCNSALGSRRIPVAGEAK